MMSNLTHPVTTEPNSENAEYPSADTFYTKSGSSPTDTANGGENAPGKKHGWSITPSFDNVPFQEIPGIWLNWRAIKSKHGKKPRKVPFQPTHPNQQAKVNDMGRFKIFYRRSALDVYIKAHEVNAAAGCGR